MLTRSRAPVLPSLGRQRFWFWRGWRIRYTFLMPADVQAQQRTPLLLVHGFGANLNQWRHNLIVLSQHQPVYAVDLLGFGGSEKAATLYGTTLWAAQVRDFCEEVIGRPVVLGGHSLGALVALTVAAHYSIWVDKLVMLTLPVARQELVSGWVDRVSRSVESVVATPILLRSLFSFVRRPHFLRSALRKIYSDPSRVDDELVSVFALPPQERGAARTLCYLVKSRTEPDFSPSTRELVERLKMPILLLWGDEDRVIPPLWGDKLADANPRLTFHRIPRVGHCLYDEDPDTINHLILEWLNP